MNDIVERLRRWAIATDTVPASDLMDEAADEIARLRLLVPPIAGTVNAETGMDFIPWSVAASAGQAADISRRVAVLPQGFEMRRLSQWIPVGERLPPAGLEVLCWYGELPRIDGEQGRCGFGWMESDSQTGELTWDVLGTFDDPTNWMQLPEPPQEAT